MEFRSKNLLVTGGAGFIGYNFINNILNKYKDISIINLDILGYASNYDKINLINDSRHHFIKGDICDKKLVVQIFKDFKIDGVINFAAESHVDNSISNPDIFVKTNINGVFNLLKVANEFWMDKPFFPKNKFKNSRFHQVSTDEVYGSIKSGSSDEKFNYSPNSPYSASKGSADLLVRSFNVTYGLNTTISISSNNFGQYQHSEKFMPKVFKSLIENSELNIYGDGSNIRDWIEVNDNCDAIDLIYNKGTKGQKYNVGGEIVFQISNW